MPKKLLLIPASALLILLMIWGISSKQWFVANKSWIFVDESKSFSGLGVSWWPLNSLEDALSHAAADEGKPMQIILASDYTGNIELPQNTTLTGQDSIITGTLTINDDSHVNNVTVTGPDVGIRVNPNSHISLDGVLITKNSKDGVEILEGSRAIITRSEFRENEKGLYVKRDSYLSLTGSVVHKNDGEGVDVRAAVESVITNNTITENEESGIEYVIGKSTSLIKDNILSDNGASGVSIQFYADDTEFGDFTIVDNIIQNNDSYALKCSKPGRGKKPPLYYQKSANLSGNTLEGNKKGAIIDTCKITQESS